MAILADDDFQSYAPGLNPPFTYYQNASVAGATTVEVSGGSVPMGQFGQSKVLAIGSGAVQYPQLPTITLAQALAGKTYANSGVPAYTNLTLFFGTRIAGSGGTDEQGFLLQINNNINPYNGDTILRVDINSDGTFSFVSPGIRWATSDFSLLTDKWYFIQLNAAFSNNGGFIQVDATLAVNGIVVLSGTQVTVAQTGHYPNLYVNNLIWSPVGGGGGYLANTTIYDTIQTIGDSPHPGVPNALVSQGVIELIKHPTSTPPLIIACPLGTATIGVPYDAFVPASGGQLPYTFAVTSGSLPPGLVLNFSTGEITGTPTASGSFPFTITVTDFFGTMTSSSGCSILVAGLANCSERFGPKLYFWEPSYLDRPEDIQMRATDWEDAGLVGAKFCQGFTLEADTNGVDKSITLQGDQNNLQTYTINHNGQQIKPYTFRPAKVASLLRLISTDQVDWRFFGIKYLWEPLPELVTYYKTQGTTHDLPGYQFLKDGYIAHISTADITLTINVDGTDFVYNIPNSGGLYTKTYLIFGINGTSGQTLKGKLYTYQLRSTAGFRLFQKDYEVFVHYRPGGD